MGLTRRLSAYGQFATAVTQAKALVPDIERQVAAGMAPPKSSVITAAQLLETAPEKAQAILQGHKSLKDVQREVQQAAARRPIAGGAARECWAAALAGLTDTERFDAWASPFNPMMPYSSPGAMPALAPRTIRAVSRRSLSRMCCIGLPNRETVLDPMAGGGTVPDVCLVMGRACYAYDINHSPGVISCIMTWPSMAGRTVSRRRT